MLSLSPYEFVHWHQIHVYASCIVEKHLPPPRNIYVYYLRRTSVSTFAMRDQVIDHRSEGHLSFQEKDDRMLHRNAFQSFLE